MAAEPTGKAAVLASANPSMPLQPPSVARVSSAQAGSLGGVDKTWWRMNHEVAGRHGSLQGRPMPKTGIPHAHGPQ